MKIPTLLILCATSVAFAADDELQRILKETTASQRSINAQANAVELKYDSPEQLAAKVQQTAQAKMFSSEEKAQALSKIPEGGAVEVSLYSTVIGSADPKWLTYVITDSAGKVLGRFRGHSSAPVRDGWRWVGFDNVPLTFDCAKLRIYHEVLGTFWDYVIPSKATGLPPVTVTQAVAIQMPDGASVTLPIGTRVEVVSRDSTEVRIRYMGTEHFVPISATDLR